MATNGTSGQYVDSLVPESRMSSGGYRTFSRGWSAVKVIKHIGTNDIGRKRDGILQSEHREVGKRLKSRTSKVVICRSLPVPCASQGRNRKIGQINVWLRSWCKSQGFLFVGPLGVLLGQR